MIRSLTTQICPRMIMMLLHVLDTIELWDAVETIDSLDHTCHCICTLVSRLIQYVLADNIFSLFYQAARHLGT